MMREMNGDVSRRTFVRTSSLAAGGVLVGGRVSKSVLGDDTAKQATAIVDSQPWSTRVLGRTGVPVTTMTLGTAPCGLSPAIPPREIGEIVREAIELGITSIDTAPAYKQSEEGIGMVLGPHRKDVFLASKVRADTIEEAEESLSTSFKLLKTDWIDLIYFHSVGDRDIQAALKPDGVFTWLLKQKKAGKFRFLGISGHNRPGNFIPLLETGEVDVVLTLVNFVDRYTYGFDHKVMPLLRAKNIGLVAMKVFGGASKAAGSYENPKAPPELELEHLETAVRYALGVPGVATLNLGVHNREQLRHNVQMVQRYKPLEDADLSRLETLGKQLAQQWGTHFGPVV